MQETYWISSVGVFKCRTALSCGGFFRINSSLPDPVVNKRGLRTETGDASMLDLLMHD